VSQTLSLERLYHPDGKHLGSLVSGLSGSGKTTAVITTLQQAIRSPKFGESHRFIIIDPKTQNGDYDLISEPLLSVDDAMKSIRKNRVTLFWPNVDFLESHVSQIVDFVFEISDSNPDTSFSFVLDEASILITPTKIPNSLKRLSLQGRAKRIKPIFISQRPIINRWTDANMSNLILFNTMPVDYDTLSRRWGVDFDTHSETMRNTPYSFVWFDMEQAKFYPMAPVDLPKINFRKKKKGVFKRLFDPLS